MKKKKKLTKYEKSVLKARKKMPCPTGTKVHKNKKKEANKMKCRRNKDGDN